MRCTFVEKSRCVIVLQLKNLDFYPGFYCRCDEHVCIFKFLIVIFLNICLSWSRKVQGNAFLWRFSHIFVFYSSKKWLAMS